ncbi:unnamed protein product [Cylindrotheca closterium]|uniref:Uncharacterized protein n=1 Tax=Cylindrotheca closterium TaxID=2856 RepID=A0AAD2GBX3_9STRA|nr:unnamed protein product [Cylindrotheca closterium]
MQVNTKLEAEYSLHGSSSGRRLTTTSLNEKLNTEKVKETSTDETLRGQAEKRIIDFVGDQVTPRQLLGSLRVLKAVTTCFLVLTLLANLMYIIFVEVVASKHVKKLAGGRRDFLIRLFGLALNVMSILIELDYSQYTSPFFGYKGYLQRGLLLFFVAIITSPDPTHHGLVKGYADDDYYVADAENSISGSAVGFQAIASFVLGACGLVYFAFGVLLIDRFTSDSFVTTDDPVVTTAIPTPDEIEALDRPGNSRPVSMQGP